MEENHRNNLLQSKPRECWTSSERANLIKTCAVYFSDLKAFGEADIESIITKYGIYFDRKYTVNQVIAAVHKHCEKSNEIPRVSDLNKFLDPETPKITQTEYITAKENWAKEGYKSHCYWRGVMNDFEAQEAEGRNIEPVADVPLNTLIADITKKLEAKQNK